MKKKDKKKKFDELKNGEGEVEERKAKRLKGEKEEKMEEEDPNDLEDLEGVEDEALELRLFHKRQERIRTKKEEIAAICGSITENPEKNVSFLY